MPKIKKFFVQFNANRSKKVAFENIDDQTTVGALKQLIIDKEGTGLGQVSTLMYSSKTMQDDKTLAYYQVKKLRTIFATFKLRGGTSVSVSLNKDELSKLQVKFSSHECGLNGAYVSCASSDTQRMKLPLCTATDKNCWYCYKCLQDTFQRAVNNLQTRIECPNKCGDFGFDTILACCHYDEEVEGELLYQYDKNELEKKGVKECPGCKNYVTKPKEIKGNKVRCPNRNCEWNSKDYCFLCSKQWQNSNSDDKCGREECEDNYAVFAESQLLNCGTKDYTYASALNQVTITIEDIPLIRMCPNPSCTVLIEWDDACKHLTCPKCQHGYCHSCLKAWNSCRCRYCRDNKLETCKLSTKCTPAPRQDAMELLGI